MSEKRRESILESQLVLVAAQFGRLGLGLIVTLLLVRQLDEAGFAAFVLIMTACAFAAQLVDAGLQPALVSALSGAGGAASLFRRVYRLRVIIAILVTILVLSYDELLPAPPQPLWFWVLGVLCLPARGFNAVFAATQRNRVTAAGNLALQLAFFLAVVLLISSKGEDAVGAILVAVCIREIGLSLYPLAMARGRLGSVESPRRSEKQRGLFLLSAATIFGAAYIHVDVFMLETMCGAAEVSSYGLATRVLLPVMVGGNLMAAPFLPHLARRLREGERPASRDLVAIAAVLLGAMLPAAICFESSEALTTLLAGDSRPQAARALRELALVPAAVAFGCVFSLGLVVARRYRAWALVTSAGLILNIVLNRMWIPEEGAVGAARATLITEAVVALGAGVAIYFSGAATGLTSPRIATRLLALALFPTLLLLSLRLILGPAETRAELVLLILLALGAALLHTFRGPARELRAIFESESGR